MLEGFAIDLVIIILIIVLVAWLAGFLLIATLVGLLVWLVTGNLIFGAIAFLVVALIQLFMRRGTIK